MRVVCLAPDQQPSKITIQDSQVNGTNVDIAKGPKHPGTANTTDDEFIARSLAGKKHGKTLLMPVKS